MFLESQKSPITGDDEGGASLESRRDVLVVVGVFADPGELLCARNKVRQHDEVLEPELRVSATEHLAHLGVSQGTQHFVHDGRRDNHLETGVAHKLLDEPARRARRLDDGADVDVRVEDSAEQRVTWSCGEACGSASWPSAAPRALSRVLVPRSPCFASVPRGAPARAALRTLSSARAARPAPAPPVAFFFLSL